MPDEGVLNDPVPGVRSKIMRGAIQHRKNRSSPWRARYRAPDGSEVSRSFTRKLDAERWLQDELAKLNRGLWIDPSAGRVTFAEWADTWIAGLDIKPKSRAGYESLLRSRVLPAFGLVELRRITPALVREWITDMVDEGLSASRIRQSRQLLGAALGTAVNDGILGRNPVSGVKVPTARPRHQRFLDAEQVNALAEAADAIAGQTGLAIDILGWVGLRWGELVALKVSSVDPLRRRITVSEAATEVRGRLVFGTPKSHRTRTVVMPSWLAERIGQHLDGRKPGDLVATAPHGGPLRASNFRRNVWTPAVDAAGIEPGLRMHDLRHTAASLMISSGASIKAVQRQLGHASAAMTLDLYGHLYDDDLDALADALDQRFAATRTAEAPPKHEPNVVTLPTRPRPSTR